MKLFSSRLNCRPVGTLRNSND